MNQVADMLNSTVQSVNSALKRARTKLRQRQQMTADREQPPVAGSASEKAIVAKFLNAYESARNSKGMSSCDVPPFDSSADVMPSEGGTASNPSSPLTTANTAVPAEAPFEIDKCTREFSASTVLDPVEPVFTRTYMDAIPPYGYTAIIEVAVDPVGHFD